MQSKRFPETKSSNDDYYQHRTPVTLDNLQKSQLAAKFKQQNKFQINVLDLACGRSPGFFALKDYFSQHGIEINYVGIDISPSIINDNEKTFENYRNAIFIALDASNPLNLRDALTPHFADLIFCQHPQVQVFGYGGEGVQNMLRKTLPYYLSPNGYVYISCYLLEEWNFISQLQSNGCRVFPCNEEQKECLYIHRDQIRPYEKYVYVSLVPLKVDQLCQKEKVQQETPALLTCSMFKTVMMDTLTSITNICCRRKSGVKKS